MLDELTDFSSDGKRKLLRRLFPGAIDDENKVDLALICERLEEFGFGVRNSEKYDFSWTGKADALHLAQSPPNGILKPRFDLSIDFAKTKNVFVAGDNLEVLKILAETLEGKVKMIYIDPPYNTNSGQKIYMDDFREKKKDYRTGSNSSLKSDQGMAEYGRIHSRWLSMIYPRIIVARKLLREDGMMFVSINDTEMQNLRLILSEIFGEENVETMIWKKVDSNEGKLKLVRRFRIEHEYILVAYRDREKVRFKKVDEIPIFRNRADNVDEDPRGPWMSGNISSTEKISVKTSKNYYQVVSPGGRKFRRQWKFPRAEFERLNSEKRIYWGKNGNNVPRLKVFANEPRSVYVSSVIERKGTAKSAESEMKRLLGVEYYFPHPKPIRLIQYLIDMAQTEGSIVLDFFAGSGTTAEAVLAQNALDGSDRSFVVVQLPEPIISFPVIYSRTSSDIRNTSDIARLRIVAGIDSIRKNERDNEKLNLDLGIKVYEFTPN
jgi:adenine-specific DNA-methyltransferase